MYIKSYTYLSCRIYFKSYLRTYDIYITFELKSVNFITNNRLIIKQGRSLPQNQP